MRLKVGRAQGHGKPPEHAATPPPPCSPTEPLRALGALLEAVDKRVLKICRARASVERAREDVVASAVKVVGALAQLFDELRVHRLRLGAALAQQRKAHVQAVGDLWCAQVGLGALARWAQLALDGCCPVADSDPETVLAHLATVVCPARPPAFVVHRSAPAIAARLVPSLEVWREQCAVVARVQPAWSNPQRAALPAMRTARHCLAAATTPGGDVFAVGGANSLVLDTVECLRGAWIEWEALPPMPTARQDCAACVVGTHLVVVGGMAWNRWSLPTVEAFDLERGQWATWPDMPLALMACAALAVQGKLYVLGGRCAQPSFVSRHVLAFDPSTQRWDETTSMNIERAFFGAAAGKGQLFVCGGSGATRNLADCEALDLDTGAWRCIAKMPQARCGCAAVFGGDRFVVVVGGYRGGTKLDSVVLYDLRENTWSALPPMQVPRDECAGVCVGRSVLVLGGFNHKGFLSSCERLLF